MTSEKFIENFDFIVKKSNEELTIQVEDHASGEFFQKVLNKETCQTLSNDSFFNFDTIYNILENYKKGDSESNESLTLTEDGKLTYSCLVMMGNINKKSGFSIDLEKPVSDPGTKHIRSFKSFYLKISKLEEKLDAQAKSTLERFTKANEERFNAFEKRLNETVQGLESNLNDAIFRIKTLDQPKQLEFRMRDELSLVGENIVPKAKEQNNKVLVSHHPSQLEENKITTKPKEPNNRDLVSHHPSLLKGNKIPTRAKEPNKYVSISPYALPKGRKSEVSFLILHVSGMVVGIAPEGCQNNNEVFHDKATIGYSHNGYFYCEGEKNEGELAKYDPGDQVTFHVDLQTGIVNIFVNWNIVHEYQIDKEYLDKKYYPFICSDLIDGAKFL